MKIISFFMCYQIKSFVQIQYYKIKKVISKHRLKSVKNIETSEKIRVFGKNFFVILGEML